jgi:hypothetical protein
MSICTEFVINNRVAPVFNNNCTVYHAKPPLPSVKSLYKDSVGSQDKRPHLEPVPGRTWFATIGGKRCMVDFIAAQRHHNALNEMMAMNYPNGSLIAVQYDTNKLQNPDMLLNATTGVHFRHPERGHELYYYAFHTQSSKQGVLYFANKALYPLIAAMQNRLKFCEKMTYSGLLFCDAASSVYFQDAHVVGVNHGYILKGHVTPTTTEIMKQIEAGTAHVIADGRGITRRSYAEVSQIAQWQHPLDDYVIYPEWDMQETAPLNISLADTLDPHPDDQWLKDYLHAQDVKLMYKRCLSEKELTKMLLSADVNKELDKPINIETLGMERFLNRLIDLDIDQTSEKFSLATQLISNADGLSAAVINSLVGDMLNPFDAYQNVAVPVFRLKSYKAYSLVVPHDKCHQLYDGMETIFYRYPFTDGNSTYPVVIVKGDIQSCALSKLLLRQIRFASIFDNFNDVYAIGKGTQTISEDEDLEEVTLVEVGESSVQCHYLSDVDVVICTKDTKIKTDVNFGIDTPSYLDAIYPNFFLSFTAVLKPGRVFGIPEVRL